MQALRQFFVTEEMQYNVHRTETVCHVDSYVVEEASSRASLLYSIQTKVRLGELLPLYATTTVCYTLNSDMVFPPTFFPSLFPPKNITSVRNIVLLLASPDQECPELFPLHYLRTHTHTIPSQYPGPHTATLTTSHPL